jgi:hypothetical protein
MADIVRPNFPALVDNSMRGDFVFCKQKFFRSYIEQLAGAMPSIHLHAGGAFAFALEMARKAFFDEELSDDEARRVGLEALIRFYGDFNAPPTKSGDKSCENLIRAFDSYFKRYPLGKDFILPFKAANGKHLIEFTFSIPTEVKHPVTGDPVLYGGRSDMIGTFNDMLFVDDEKTSTQLGEQWANQWLLESSITGYIKAAQVYGYPVVGGVMRGIGLLKTKITHAETIIYRSPWQIERWWEQLQRDIRSMIRSWEEGYWDYALSKNQCGAYGGCTFQMLCESPQPDQWIPIHFRRRVWDPLAKDNGENLLENKEMFKDSFAPELNIPGVT